MINHQSFVVRVQLRVARSAMAYYVYCMPLLAASAVWGPTYNHHAKEYYLYICGMMKN